jgi:type IV secretory pathway TrbD component
VTPSQPARPESFLNHSVSIFLIRFFPSLAALLVMVWFSRHLPEGVYGNYQYFWVQFYICSAVACLGIHAFIITYSPQVLERLLQGLPRLLPVSVLIWIGIAGTGFALLQQASGFSFYTPLLFLFTGACATIAESFLIVYRRFRLLTAGSLLYALLFCLLHWLALEQGISMNNLFLALSVVGAARLCVYLIIILRHRRQAAIAERSVKSECSCRHTEQTGCAFSVAAYGPV